LTAFWLGVQSLPLAENLRGVFSYAFCSLALLLAPLWLFGFGAGEWLRDKLSWRAGRVILPALLGIPYAAFAVPAGNFHWPMAAAMFGLPVVLAALLEFSSPVRKFCWQDAAVLAVLILTYMLRLLAKAWPYPGLAALPKLYVADLALYLYLVVRRLEGMGYCFMPRRDRFLIGFREWLYFLPFGIGLGAALRFIHFHPVWPSPLRAAETLLATFLLIAIPEEMFFRGILQNLLETRIGRRAALISTAILFGLAHFNKGAAFNWRYVLLATIAGVFYGRAWRERRQLLASLVTHTAVDVVWSLWFR
jgi:CAAX protease family protein